MKKFLSFLLSAVMLISVFSSGSMAATVEDYGLPFTDLADNAWYLDGVAYCYYNGYVNGMTETTFSPNTTLTRAQFVQMLAGFAGAELSDYEGLRGPFDDVKPGHWYNNAVCWAYSQGIVAGLSETRFGPNEPVTREQLARLLYVYGERLADEIYLDMTPRADLSGFEDVAKVSSWAYEQVEWAVAAGIISGTSETALSPRAQATRAQSCRMLMVFDEYMMNGGLKDTSGVFAALVEYALENGDSYVDDYGDIIYTVMAEYGECSYILEYDDGMKSLALVLNHDLREVVYEDGIYEEYATQTYISFDRLSSEYYFNVNHSFSDDGSVYYWSSGNIYINGFDYSEAYGEGMTPVEIKADSDAALAEFSVFIDWIVDSVGYTPEDFYKGGESYTEPEKTGIFKDLPEYIVANGTENPMYFGEYDITKTVGDTIYSLEYNIFGDIIYMSYYSDPYSYEVEGEMYTDYNNTGYVYIMQPSDVYEYDFYGTFPEGSGTVNGYADSESCEFYNISVDEGVSEEAIVSAASTVYTELLAAADELLAPLGYSAADFFVAE